MNTLEKEKKKAEMIDTSRTVFGNKAHKKEETS